MNNYKPSNNLTIFCFTGLLLLANNSYAVDMGVLQEQCAEIGFKMKTPENGKCVLKLMKSVASQQAKEAVQQRAYVNQQTVSPVNAINIACRIDSDCNDGLHCRSKSDGGTECSTIASRPQQMPIQRQNEAGERQRLAAAQRQQVEVQNVSQSGGVLDVLGKVAIGALYLGTAFLNGYTQSYTPSVPAFYPIIQSAPSSVQPIQNTESFRCRTRMSISGSSANTTCEK